MKQITKRRLIGIPLVAILVVVALLGIAGGVYAAFDIRHMTNTGTITVNDAYGYSLSTSTVAFGTPAAIFSDKPLSVDSSVITFTNDGDQVVTGFALSNVQHLPAGMRLSVTPNFGLSVANGEHTDLTFHITSVVGTVAPASYDLSSLAVTCDVVPTCTTLVFDTGITSDVTVTGALATSFVIPTGGVAGVMHVLSLDSTDSNPELADGMYAFTLTSYTYASTETLPSYFSAKAGWNASMIAQIGKEIAGSSPFFYFNAASGVYTLVDGFKTAVGITPTVLTIDDDYPVGTYVYTGTITGTNGATLPITVTLEVTR